jgi:hypothetical protein
MASVSSETFIRGLERGPDIGAPPRWILESIRSTRGWHWYVDL